MSWKLLRDTEELPYFLFPASVCKVGRAGCQILLQDLSFIARNDDLLSCTGWTLVLKDVSKFVQTSVNDILLTAGKRESVLNQGDKLTFGAAVDIFTVEYSPLVYCVSDPHFLPSLRSVASSAGVELSAEGVTNSVTGLLTSEMDSSNEMILTALIYDKPILRSEYIERLSQCFSGCRQLPLMTDFQWSVPVAEIDRAKLFGGMSFTVPDNCDSQQHSIRNLLSLTGATVVDDDSAPQGDLLHVVYSGGNSQLPTLPKSKVLKFATPCIIKRCIFQGSVDELESLPEVNVTPTQPQAVDYGTSSGWGWITTKAVSSNTLPTARPHNMPVQVALSTTYVPGRKRFRKISAVSATFPAQPFELSKWDGSSARRHRHKSKRDEIDDWLSQYADG